MHSLDFETEAIAARPHYPPTPVGIACSIGKGSYNRGTAMQRALDYWDGAIFHNASFDIAVGMEKLGLPFPKNFEDTLYALALLHPYAPTLSLKPSIERILKRKPVEQTKLREWILANVNGARKDDWGAHIAKAPESLVAPYAIQDAKGTEQLFKHLWKDIIRYKMQEPYAREKRLLPMLLDNERRGIRVNLPKLKRDTRYYRELLAAADRKIAKGFGLKSLDVDSNEQLADAIEKLTGKNLPRTPKDNRQTDRATLMAAPLPPKLKAFLLYRSKLAQDLRTFMMPWLQVAIETKGVIHTHWNQVRGASHENKKGGGARTGRMSSEPNLQNITNPEKVEELQLRLAALTRTPPASWEFPRIRDYIVPWQKGWVLYGRDLNQQELRLMADVEEGPIRDLYRKHPDIDIHEAVRQLIKLVAGVEIPRKVAKILNFLTIYGGGLDALVAQSGLTYEEGERVRQLYFRALPSIKTLMREFQRQAAIRTVGGRRYEPQPPRVTRRGIQRFEYKLLNYYIQGSAADQVKEIMVQWWEQFAADNNLFYVQVHDELLFSCPREDVVKQQSRVRVLMRDTFNDRLTLPFLSSGEVGVAWASMKDCD